MRETQLSCDAKLFALVHESQVDTYIDLLCYEKMLDYEYIVRCGQCAMVKCVKVPLEENFEPFLFCYKCYFITLHDICKIL